MGIKLKDRYSYLINEFSCRKKRGARGGFPGVWKDSSGDSDNPDPGEGGAGGTNGAGSAGGAAGAAQGRMSGRLILFGIIRYCTTNLLFKILTLKLVHHQHT